MATCPSGHESAADDFCDVCGFRIGPATALAPDPPDSALPGARPPGGAVPVTPAPGPPCPRCGAQRTGRFCEQCGYDHSSAAPVTPVAAPSPPPPVPAPQPRPAPAPSPSQLDPTRVDPLWWSPPSAPAPVAPSPSRPAPSPQPSSPPAQPALPPPRPPAPAPPSPPPSFGVPTGTWSAVVTADRAYFESVLANVGPDAPQLSFPAYCPERRFRLSGAEVRVGRRSVSRGIDPEIDLTGPPADPGVSRLHALLVADPDGTWSVIDPGSQNGMLVNGNEVPANQAVPLHDGDRIHLGAWTALTITRDR